MDVIYAPNDLNTVQIGSAACFLNGGIEHNMIPDWQEVVIDYVSDINNGAILNSKRLDWLSTTPQTVDNADFRSQLSWEITAMTLSGLCAFYFPSGTSSLISLCQFSQYAPSSVKFIMYADPDYQAKGILDVMCRNYKILQCVSFADFQITIRDYFLGKFVPGS